jgi:hypothetical protein
MRPLAGMSLHALVSCGTRFTSFFAGNEPRVDPLTPVGMPAVASVDEHELSPARRLLGGPRRDGAVDIPKRIADPEHLRLLDQSSSGGLHCQR